MTTSSDVAMSVTVWQSLLAALPGFAALVWHIYAWLQERKPKVHICRERMLLISKDLTKVSEALLVRIANMGKIPVTLVDFCWRPHNNDGINHHLGPFLDESRLPLTLRQGEFKEMHLMFDDIIGMSGGDPGTVECWFEDSLRRKYHAPRAGLKDLPLARVRGR